MDCLILAHLIGDWIFQTEHQAVHKMQGTWHNSAIVNHCAVYTFCFMPLAWAGLISWWMLVPIFASHMFLDRRWPVVWWIKTVKQTSEQTIAALPWLLVAVDQIFHTLVLVCIATFS